MKLIDNICFKILPNSEGGFYVESTIFMYLFRRKHKASSALLAAYEALTLPIFVTMTSPNDHKAAERERIYNDMLMRSNNTLYLHGKLLVCSLYFRQGKYSETFEEYEKRVVHFKNTILDAYERSFIDTEWKKTYLYGQENYYRMD